jgi:hypothetical protein
LLLRRSFFRGEWKRVLLVVFAFIMVLVTIASALSVTSGNRILSDVDSGFVNLASNSDFSFKVRYVDGFGSPLFALERRGLVSDVNGVVVKSVDLLEVERGVYLFNADFSSLETGNYVVRVGLGVDYVDVPVVVSDFPTIFSVFYDGGLVNRGRVIAGLVVCFALAFVLILVAMVVFKKKGGRK